MAYLSARGAEISAHLLRVPRFRVDVLQFAVQGERRRRTRSPAVWEMRLAAALSMVDGRACGCDGDHRLGRASCRRSPSAGPHGTVDAFRNERIVHVHLRGGNPPESDMPPLPTAHSRPRPRHRTVRRRQSAFYRAARETGSGLGERQARSGNRMTLRRSRNELRPVSIRGVYQALARIGLPSHAVGKAKSWRAGTADPPVAATGARRIRGGATFGAAPLTALCRGVRGREVTGDSSRRGCRDPYDGFGVKSCACRVAPSLSWQNHHSLL